MSGSSNSARVVVGVDGSTGSLAALQFSFDEAKRRATGLLVMTAFELPDLWSMTSALPVSCSVDQVQDNVLQNTRRVVTETLGDQITADGAPKVDVVARGGSAAQVLVSASVGSPLIVVGSRGLSGFRRMLLGSVSLACALHASCPVTVVRSADDHDRWQPPEMAGAPAAIL